MIITASGAFQEQLKQLCLSDFPSGLGTWREDYQDVKATLRTRDTIPKPGTVTHYTVTLKDTDANCEKTEVLSEYVSAKKSPWLMDYSWSKEARQLREIAVRSPWLLTKDFVYAHFKTLRILDKRVSDVDQGMAELINLDELSLVANHLISVNSSHLPPSLKLLELCANQISDLSPLVVSPPPLEHLGLGMNQLRSIEDHITVNHWPNLLSLDLSKNHLTELLDVVSKLVTLPRLRYLLLNGNPLSVIPGYRGYVIDSLKGLLILDDIPISADERHYFKGMVKRKEHILDEVQVRFKVDFLRNIPIPDEIKCPSDFPELPMIVRKYFIQFWYPLDPEPPNEGDFQLTVEDTDMSGDNEGAHLNSTEAKVHDRNHSEVQRSHGMSLAPVRSSSAPFSQEDMQLDWSGIEARWDIRTIRDFFGYGIDLDVIEEKCLLYPPGEAPAPEVNKSPLSRRASMKKGAAEKQKEPPSGKKSADKGGKKKKKMEEADLVVYSKELTTITSFHLNLSGLLEPDCPAVEQVLVTSGPILSTPPTPVLLAGRDKVSRLGDKKGDKAALKAVASKGGKPGGKKGADQGDDEGDLPLPTEVKVGVQLVRFSSTRDLIRSEEQTTAPQPPEQVQ